jgi:hypothetical protein
MLFVSDYSVSRASSRCPRAVRTRCHASFARAVPRAMACWVARAVLRASPHVIFVCRTCGSCASPRVVRALSHVCRATSVRDNKLFSFINAHVSNVNLSDHIC